MRQQTEPYGYHIKRRFNPLNGKPELAVYAFVTRTTGALKVQQIRRFIGVYETAKAALAACPRAADPHGLLKEEGS